MLSKNQLHAILERKRQIKSLRDCLFPAQLKMVDDGSRRKLAKTTRRAGKTTAALIECLVDGLENPGRQYCYIALTRPSAEGIVWHLAKQIDVQYGLGCTFQEAKLRLTLPTGSQVTLYGADKPGWQTRLHGHKFAKVVIDEAGYYSVNLKRLINDAIGPTLIDYDGQLILVSTPGYYKSGYYWRAFTGEIRGWSNHEWTTHDNPHMSEQFAAEIERYKRDNPDTWQDDPDFIRNYIGSFVDDQKDQIYRFSRARNIVHEFQKLDTHRFVLGLDLGWNDQTAFSVSAFSENSEDMIELENVAHSEMLLDEVARTVRSFMDQYPGIIVTGDASNKQLFQELVRRYGLPIIPGERTNKESYINLINSDLSRGKIQLLSGFTDKHADQMEDLTWSYRPNGRRVEDPRVKNDRCDAFLYAYRLSYHYRGKKPTAPPIPGSPEYWKQEEDRMELDALDELEGETC